MCYRILAILRTCINLHYAVNHPNCISYAINKQLGSQRYSEALSWKMEYWCCAKDLQSETVYDAKFHTYFPDVINTTLQCDHVFHQGSLWAKLT